MIGEVQLTPLRLMLFEFISEFILPQMITCPVPQLMPMILGGGHGQDRLCQE